MQVILNLVITLILSVLAIGLLVFIHELGHFLAAKRSGVVVQEFAFGFGPKLFSKKYKGTEYKLNAVPFGGYCKMLGDIDGSSLARFGAEVMSDSDMEFVRNLFYNNHINIETDDFNTVNTFFESQFQTIPEEDYRKLETYFQKVYIPRHPGNFDNVSTGKRLFIITAGVIMNFLLGIILLYIYFALNGNYTDLRKLGNPVFIGAEVNVPPIIWFDYSTDNGGEYLVINADGKLMKNSYDLEQVINNSYDKPVQIYALNLLENKYQTVPLILDGVGLKSSLDKDFTNKIMITGTDNTGVAYQSGIETGDIILGLNGVLTDNIDIFKAILAANRGKEVSMEFFTLRGEEKTVKINLPQVPDGEPILGASLIKTEILISEYDSMLNAMRVTYQQYPYLSGVLHSINMTGYNFTAFYELIKQSIKEKSIQPVSQSVSSILAVPDIFYTLVKGDNYVELINIAALISLSLAIMNILPIPLFDGGHILFMVIEKIRGKKLSQKSQEKIGTIIFYLLIALSIVIVLKDVVQFDWFNRIIGFLGGIFK